MIRAAERVDDLLAQARDLVKAKQYEKALDAASKAIQLDPKDSRGYLLRAAVHAQLRRPKEAVADYDKVLALKPGAAEVYNERGSEHFKLGHIKESLADFDRFIALRPREKNGHWKRGISLYYAGRFDEGRKQFEGYEEIDTNDVENAVWHFLCLARAAGVAKARKSLLKIGKDRRVPMMQVYALYAGKAKPEDVLAAAREVPRGAAPDLLPRQLFYAHLYLGLYYEVLGDTKKALEHMEKAAGKYRIGHYMGDVARVHRDILKRAANK